MKIYQIITTVVLLVFGFASFAQEPIVFDKKYRFENLGCITTDVKQTPDSGYIAVGFAAISIGNYSFLIYKTDSFGELEWYKRHGIQACELSGVDISSEGNYIAVGQTQDNSDWFRYATIIKYNTQGDTLWKKVYTLPVSPAGAEMSQSVFKDVICTKDSAIVAAGWCENGSYLDPYIVKTDLNGDTIWTWRAYAFQEGTGFDINVNLESIAETPEGDYVAVGQSDEPVDFGKEYGQTRGVIVKISNDGELLYFKEFEDINYTQFKDIDINNQGELAITGGIIGYYLDNMENAILLKANADGETLFYQEIYSAFYVWARSVCFTSDGSILFGGYLMPPWSENWDQDIILQNYDPLGNLNWEKTIGGKDSYTDIAKIIRTYDNGFIIGGHYSNDTLNHSWLLKLDSLGNGVYDPGWINSVAQQQFAIDVLLYPNPASEFVNIETSDNSKTYDLEIYTITGQKVFEKTNNIGLSQINVSGFSQGIYLLNIKSDKKVYTGKLSVKH